MCFIKNKMFLTQRIYSKVLCSTKQHLLEGTGLPWGTAPSPLAGGSTGERLSKEQVQILRADKASEPHTPWAKLWEMLGPTLLTAASKRPWASQALSWGRKWKAWGPGSPLCPRKARLGLRFLLSTGSQKRLGRDLGQGSLES